MNEFVLQLAVIFLPGIIWARIDAYYSSRRAPNEFHFILNAFVFGVSTYVLVYLLYLLFGWRFSYPAITGSSGTTPLDGFIDEIICSIPVSFAGSILWCYCTRRRFLMRLLHFTGASNAFGDEDVWELSFNSDDVESKYVNIRDRDNGLVYSGYVRAFSGTDQKRELVLINAIVYDDLDGSEIYSSPRLYLERTDKWFAIEFPTGLARDADVKE